MTSGTGASALEARLQGELARLRAQNLYRVRRTVRGAHAVEVQVDGKRAINFCSNDYLGLAADPRVSEAARTALAETGMGSGASALVSGYNHEHRRLEERLAEFVGRARALLFASGWAANVGVLRALLSRDDTLVADELNHASLIDGGRLSGARYQRIAHRDLAGFERALRSAEGFRLLATDAVFSMDGDVAPLSELSGVCRRHAATLMVDDAHGFGVLGPSGRGAAERLGRDEQPEILVATLGKSLGVAGAFVAGSEALIEFLIQRARSWVFSTAPPPALAAAARRSLEILQAEPERRAQLSDNVRRFSDGAKARGIALAESTTPIQPLILGDESKALALSAELLRHGYWVTAIRPPTVPRGTARLRITLSAAHTAAHVDGLLDAMTAGLRQLAEAA